MKKDLLLFAIIMLPMVASADDSGKCGDNVSYVYTEATKTLTISGSGKMDDFSSSSQPWYVYSEDIEKIVIQEGVTTIGKNAFYKFSNLLSITIPSSVKSIGRLSFRGCTNLQSLYLPEGVDSIYDSAFYLCSNLKSVSIPSSLKYIEAKNFGQCPQLEKVEITDLVSWCNISFQGGSANPCKTAHKLFLNGKEIIDLVIPENVTKICGYSFVNCSSIKTVSLPNSLTSIGECSFDGCSSLSSIEIPNSMTSIDERAFYGCTGLKSIVMPNSIISIGNYAFYGCSLMESINIPNSVTSIGEGAFYECYSLHALELPNSLKSISDKLFSGCISLTSVTIPKSITTIGGYSFDRCYILNEILCYAEETPSISSSLGSVPINEIKLYVPDSSVALYKSTSLWTSFKEILPLTEYGSGNTDTESINKNVECTVQWNGKYSSSVTPWESIYSRGIDINVSNNTNEDLKIIRIDYYINADGNNIVPNTTNIRVNSGETKIISFSLEGSTDPTTLPWLKMYYKVGNNEYIKVVKNTGTTSSIKNVTDVTDSNLSIKEIYDYYGRRLNRMSKGLNIILYNNGITRKVFVK